MSGGRLVVLDRAGRDGKHYPLAEGLATLGSDIACDIRIMLPTVSPHHATVVVHANQTVVRNMSSNETQVNGRVVSVAALRHGDVISIGGRHLRWEYSDPTARRPQAPEPALYVSRRKSRGVRRASGPATATARDCTWRDPQLQRALEMSHRASMPGSAGAKQVAIVQPQRRDTSDHIDKSPQRTPAANKRPRASKSDLDASVSEAEQEKTKRKSTARGSPKNSPSNLQTTTKATLWIESRKTSPRKSNRPQTEPRLRRSAGATHKSTPLRLAVLRRAQSAHKMRVTKIEGPLTMDHTKQAAIRLMTGHTPKSKPSSPSFVVKKPSPVRRTPRSRNSHATPDNSRVTPGNSRATPANTRATPDNSSATPGNIRATPGTSRATPGNSRATPGNSSTRSRAADCTVTILEVTDSDGRNSTASRRSGQKSPKKSFGLISPRKSALKDPSAKRGARKTESIKFDLSNLENHSQDSDVMMLSDSTRRSYVSDDDVTLRYSESSATSPSPRRPIHSRQSRCLSRRDDLESYSVVDLVSIDTDESALSTPVYGSAGSTDSTTFGTPQNTTGRKTRSTIDPTILGSSTPYAKGRPSTPRSRSDPSLHTESSTSLNGTQSTVRSSRSTRSKSLLTPENTEDAKKHITVNSTRISRASRSRSRLNDSELLLLDEDDDSPKTSKRISTTSKSGRLDAQTVIDETKLSPAQDNGTCTPENRHSPEEATTPVLSIQSLLDSSQTSYASQKPTRKGRPSFNTKRKTIGGVTGPKTRVGAKSKSLGFSARQTRLRLSSDSAEILNTNDDSEIVTPKSAVKLLPEGVKNKHSTAKKPQSKRSIIDDLNESDIVKQLFNSPVKRKLSQSMTEFSRKQLFDDQRATRHTIALTGRTPDNSLLDHTESYTPELFVSPISTPTRSPSLEGIKLMFAKTTPENDLRNVRGVKNLLRTPRTRRSIKNDLTNVSGVKNLFAKSPNNRLSDVRVKEVFASSPNNDLRRVTGVKSLFRTANKRKSPRNELDDVRGVKKLFNTRSPANDLRNVSGVKRTLRRQSPSNDLSDVRGVKRVFRRDQRNDLSDVSGVEELFNLSNYSSATVSTRAESLFDQLVGNPQIKAVYSKTFSSKTVQRTKGPRAKSMHASLDQVTAADDNNWLEKQLNQRLQINNYLDSLKSANTSKANRSKTNKSKSMHASLDEVTDVDVLLEQELNKEQQINKYLESMRSLNESKGNKSMRSLNESKGNKSMRSLNESKGNKSMRSLNESKGNKSMRALNESKGNISMRSLNKSKGNKSKVNKSKADHSRVNKSKAHTSKTNISRELQKLITDTVEGDAPLRASRVRSSTLTHNESDAHLKKSTSELYSAHTLPIKKRSLVNSSEKASLPLKKRVVVHSTPLKGRLHVTMNGSELGRVSPIRLDLTATQTREITEVRVKSTRGTRADTEHLETTISPEFVKPSPKKTRGRPRGVSPNKVTASSPAKENAATNAKKASNSKTKKTSPVKVKSTRGTRADTEHLETTISPEFVKPSPKKTRGRPRGVSPNKVTASSPAKENAAANAKKASNSKAKKTSPVKAKNVSPFKAKKASPVKSKKTDTGEDKKASPVKAIGASPVKVKSTSPAKAKKAFPTKKKSSPAKKLVSPVLAKTTRSRRKDVSTLESNTIKRRSTLVVAKKSPVLSPKPRATRKRKEPHTASTPKPSPKKTRATRNNTSGNADKYNTPKNTRTKVLKATVVLSKPSPQLKPRAKRGRADQTQQEATRSTRKTGTVQHKEKESPKTSQVQTKSSSKTRTAQVQPKTRGRKAVVSEFIGKADVENAKAQTKKVRITNKLPNEKRSGRQEKSIEEAKPVRTRGKKVAPQESVTSEVVPSTRAQRAAAGVADTVAPQRTTRKRKSDTAPEHEVPSKVRKSKVVAEQGRKRATDVSTDTKYSRNKSAVMEKKQEKVSEAPVKLTRGRKTAEVEPVKATKQTEQKTRGRKVNVENVQASGKRKRAAAVEPSPVKETKTRATRGNTQPDDAPAGRRRRR